MCAKYKEVAAQICNGTSKTINNSHIRDKLEADSTMHDVLKQRSGKPCTATSLASSAMVLE
jgi:hypothetical protein